MIIDKKSYVLGASNGGGGGITPTGTKEITTTDEVNVTTYAKAKVVDENLVAENIKAGIEVLGIEGEYAPSLQAKTATENGVVTPDAAYDGLSQVTVAVPDPELEEKWLDIHRDQTTGTNYIIVEPDDGYDGLSKLHVRARTLYNSSITANGTYEPSNDDIVGYNKVTVNVPTTRAVDPWNADFAFAGPQGQKSAEEGDTFADAYSTGGHCTMALIGTFAHCTKNEEDPISGEDVSPFDVNGNLAIPCHTTFRGFASAFRRSSLRNAPPIIYISSKRPPEINPSFYNSMDGLMGHNFERCYFLQHFGPSWEGVPEVVGFSDDAKEPADGCGYEFDQCFCLRKIPFALDKALAVCLEQYPNAAYKYRYDCCYSLDEIKVPVIAGNGGTDMFEETFTSCSRVNKIVFETYLNGHPKNANWYHAVINLGPDAYGVGYTLWDSVYTDYGSDISADKEVTDDESYEALKDDPDWWTQDVEYSRFNHDSAVALINSLPDCGSTANNEVIFEGASGRKTDGGAIETLTPSEIAVATAKGWSITLE